MVLQCPGAFGCRTSFDMDASRMVSTFFAALLLGVIVMRLASAPNVVTVVGAGAAGAAVAHDDQSAAAHATPARKAGRLSPVPMPSASAAADPQESPGRDGG